MKSFFEHQYSLIKTIGFFRYIKKYPYWIRKKILNYSLIFSEQIHWDRNLYNYKFNKSPMSGNWFKSSSINNLETLLPIETKQKILNKALLAKDLKFNINNEIVDYKKFPCNSRFDVDPKTGIQWPVTSIYSNIDVNVGDVRFPWEVGRLHQLIWFGQLWRITGDESWKQIGLDHIDKLMSENPIYYGIHFRDGLQIAIRLFSIIGFADLCHDSDETFHKLLTNAVITNTKVLERQLSHDSEITNNHAIGEFSALALVGVYLDDVSLINKGLKFLERELKRQIYCDGISYEGTIPYLRFNLDFLTFIYRALKAVNYNCPNFLVFYIDKISQSLSGLIDKNGFVPPIGDGDDGKVLKFDEEDYLCVTESLQLASVISNKAYATKDSSYSLTFWVLGKDSSRKKANTKFNIYKNSGISHYNNNSLDVWIDCGPTGLGLSGLGGHGHNDTTSLVVHHNNEGVLHDPGWYTYHSDPKLRDYFRSTKNHNTITINGLEQARLKNKFEILNDCKPSIFRIKQNKTKISVQCGHNGYKRINKSIKYRRYIHMIENPEIHVVVTDMVTSSIPLNIKCNLGSDLEWSNEENSGIFLSGGHKLIIFCKSKIEVGKKHYSRKNLELKNGSSFNWILDEKRLSSKKYIYKSRFTLLTYN